LKPVPTLVTVRLIFDSETGCRLYPASLREYLCNPKEKF